MIDKPTGALRLRAVLANGVTQIGDCYRTAPFHLGIPADRIGDGRAEVIIQGVGPGYFPGDRLRIDLTAESGATLVVRGQGATKLYPSPGGEAASVATRLRAEAGATLVYLPGELIPFRDGVLTATTEIDVAAGGRVALAEILMPGRTAMGEHLAYRSLDMRVEARYAGRRCLIERMRLEPDIRDVAAVGRHCGYAAVGTLYLIGGGWSAPLASHLDEPVLWAADGDECMVLVRLAGPTAQAVHAAIATILTANAVPFTPRGGHR